MIIDFYAGGMSVRDITHHLESTLVTDLSGDTGSHITREIQDEVLIWRARPSGALSSLIYLDAMLVTVRRRPRDKHGRPYRRVPRH